MIRWQIREQVHTGLGLEKERSIQPELDPEDPLEEPPEELFDEPLDEPFEELPPLLDEPDEEPLEDPPEDLLDPPEDLLDPLDDRPCCGEAPLADLPCWVAGLAPEDDLPWAEPPLLLLAYARNMGNSGASCLATKPTASCSNSS